MLGKSAPQGKKKYYFEPCTNLLKCTHLSAERERRAARLHAGQEPPAARPWRPGRERQPGGRGQRRLFAQEGQTHPEQGQTHLDGFLGGAFMCVKLSAKS